MDVLILHPLPKQAIATGLLQKEVDDYVTYKVIVENNLGFFYLSVLYVQRKKTKLQIDM